jgi:hypothetical protein
MSRRGFRYSNLTITGQRVARPMSDYPYSYSATCIYKNMWKRTDEVVYSDRLHLWYDNYDAIYKETMGTGQYFSSKEPEQIEQLLCRLFGKHIILTGVEEECNFSNGYPYWILYYREEEDASENV